MNTSECASRDVSGEDEIRPDADRVLILFLPLLFQAHVPPKPSHSDAGGRGAHSAAERRSRGRGREEALKEGGLGQLLYVQFVLMCSLTWYCVIFSAWHDFVTRCYSDFRSSSSIDPLKHKRHGAGSALMPPNSSNAPTGSEEQEVSDWCTEASCVSPHTERHVLL